jgi:hypothetical protein
MVLLDPTLTWDLPLDITRVSAVNALVHCVSGVFAAGRSPVTDLLAAGAPGSSRAGCGVYPGRALTRRPGRVSPRVHTLGGTVLAHAGGSAHHTICHILGGAFDLPHAETHTSVLPASSVFLEERDPHASERLAAALESTDLAAAIGELLEDTGAILRLRDTSLSATDLPRAADFLSDGGPGPGVAGMDSKRASALLAAGLVITARSRGTVLPRPRMWHSLDSEVVKPGGPDPRRQRSRHHRPVQGKRGHSQWTRWRHPLSRRLPTSRAGATLTVRGLGLRGIPLVLIDALLQTEVTDLEASTVLSRCTRAQSGWGDIPAVGGAMDLAIGATPGRGAVVLLRRHARQPTGQADPMPCQHWKGGQERCSSQSLECRGDLTRPPAER